MDVDQDTTEMSEAERVNRAIDAYDIHSKLWLGREASLLPLSAASFLRLLSKAVLDSEEYNRREDLAARLGMTPVQLADRLGEPRCRSQMLREPVVMGYAALLASLSAGEASEEEVT